MEPLHYEQHLLTRCIELGASYQSSMKNRCCLAANETTMTCQVKQKRGSISGIGLMSSLLFSKRVKFLHGGWSERRGAQGKSPDQLCSALIRSEFDTIPAATLCRIECGISILN
jgi:hypothetical protein